MSQVHVGGTPDSTTAVAQELPVTVLQQILKHLEAVECARCSMVCRSWREGAARLCEEWRQELEELRQQEVLLGSWD